MDKNPVSLFFLSPFLLPNRWTRFSINDTIFSSNPIASAFSSDCTWYNHCSALFLPFLGFTYTEASSPSAHYSLILSFRSFYYAFSVLSHTTESVTDSRVSLFGVYHKWLGFLLSHEPASLIKAQHKFNDLMKFLPTKETQNRFVCHNASQSFWVVLH